MDTSAQNSVNPRYAQLAHFQRELRDDPALVGRILASLPPVPSAPQGIIVRTDTVSVDAAICRALALAVEGIEVRIELIPQ